jgi:hypothetical protein
MACMGIRHSLLDSPVTSQWKEAAFRCKEHKISYLADWGRLPSFRAYSKEAGRCGQSLSLYI